MREIVLTEEQSRILSGPPLRVVFKDPTGRVVGEMDPLPDPAWIAEMKRRAAGPGPWYTGAAIRAMFDALEAERERIGPFSVEYLDQFVKRLEESDPARYGPEARP